MRSISALEDLAPDIFGRIVEYLLDDSESHVMSMVGAVLLYTKEEGP